MRSAAGDDRFGRRKPRLTTRIEDLAAALRAYAAGVYAAEAAVELLIWQRFWLTRADLVDEFVTVWPADGSPADDAPMAVIDWPGTVAALDAGRLPCSRGEDAVLRIAASLGGAGAVALGAAVTCLDEANLVRVISAVTHAGGRVES